MAKKFQNLRNKMSTERRAKVDVMTKALLAEMPMHALRDARTILDKYTCKF